MASPRPEKSGRVNVLYIHVHIREQTTTPPPPPGQRLMDECHALAREERRHDGIPNVSVQVFLRGRDGIRCSRFPCGHSRGRLFLSLCVFFFVLFIFACVTELKYQHLTIVSKSDFKPSGRETRDLCASPRIPAAHSSSPIHTHSLSRFLALLPLMRHSLFVSYPVCSRRVYVSEEVVRNVCFCLPQCLRSESFNRNVTSSLPQI